MEMPDLLPLRARSLASQAPTGSAQNQKKNCAANIKFPQILNFRGQTPVRVCEWLT
jgi:hypothetical protein